MDYLLQTTGYIFQGAGVTLKLFVVTLAASLPLGFLCAMGKTSKVKPLRLIMELYTSIVRGTPLLLQLFFVYYGLPILIPGLRFERFTAAAVTFILNYGAYFTEIFRGGIILPQTVKRVLPPVSNEAITLVKDTALVVVLGIGEILRNSKEIVSRDFTISPFIIAAGIYLALNYLLVVLFRKLEKRYAVYE